MQTPDQSTEGTDLLQTTDESSLDGAACSDSSSMILPPLAEEAPGVEVCFDWERPRHGDSLRISQWRGIDNPVVKWDELRYGFSVGGSFYTAEGDDFEYRELAFLSAEDLDENRFLNHAAGGSSVSPNDERVHHYQRGRTSITGLGL